MVFCRAAENAAKSAITPDQLRCPIAAWSGGSLPIRRDRFHKAWAAQLLNPFVEKMLPHRSECATASCASENKNCSGVVLHEAGHSSPTLLHDGFAACQEMVFWH